MSIQINKALSQASTRLSQMRAPQKRLAPISKYAIYFGKFESGLVESFEYFDGSALFNYRKVAKAINQELESLGTPFFIEDELILGMGFQARPYSIKSYFVSTTVQVIVEAIKNRTSNVVTTLHIPSMTQEDREHFIMALNKNKESKYWNKVVVITMTDEAMSEEIDFLADMNAFKAPYWPETQSYFNVLEMSHGTHGDIKMSSQLCKTLFTANAKETKELIISKTKKLVEEKMEAVRRKEASDALLKDLYGDVGQLMNQLRPDFVQEQSASLYRGNVDNMVEGLCRTINNLNLPCKGKYAAVVPELSLLFGNTGLLHFGEIYAPGLEGKEIMVIKYPKMGNHEYMVVRGITKTEYISRAAGVLTPAQFKMFKHMVETLQEGLCILPAIAEIMKLLAGLDYDGDKVGLITDKAIVAIAKQTESVITVIE